MSIRDETLAEADIYIAATGVAVSTFSEAATGDRTFVKRFRNGQNATIATVEALRRYMAANWPDGHPLPETLIPYLPPSQEAAE